MREDVIAWGKTIGKVTFWLILGVPIIAWRIIKFINCIVAHRKYHWGYWGVDFWEFQCSKCGIDTLGTRTDTPGGM